MKHISLIVIALFLYSSAIAQDDSDMDKEKPKNGWETSGNFQFLFNQSAFNAEWTGGGTSQLAGNIILNYSTIYRFNRFTWDSRFDGEYGLNKTDEDEFYRKTNDRLELNSVLGYKTSEESNWYYSFFMNFLTQFAKGYTFDEDEDGNTTRTETTRFVSPGFLQIGPGMLWKKNDNFKVNIAPATSRFIFVNEMFTTTPGYEDGDYFGVDAGETMRYELGASVNALAKFDIVKNVNVENILLLYSNYLEDPQNVDINYTLAINMKVNEWLSTNFIFQTIYDDNAVGAFQVRQVFGLGVNYAL
jgi:hypothetical protein